ncbi:MAG: glycosyltransferase family protein [Ferruginibacter sp.]
MKVLYAIQATGNGHISRATEIIPLLKKKCDLDILISGTEAEVDLDHEIKYRTKGLCYVFGKKGGIDFYATFKKMQSKRFLKEIKNIPVEEYDLVINDFEPVTAWACRIKDVPCISMSHQYGVIHPNAPRPAKYDPIASMILKHYAPCKYGVGFHFKSYGKEVFTPVIRKEIRNAEIKNLGHYTIYLPAYDEKKLIDFFSTFKNTEWHIFSKHTKKSFTEKNCIIKPVNGAEFAKSFTTCEGIVCGGGFETPAEALYMGKKLLVIPMKNQYEQHCNAAGATELGVPVIKSLKKKHIAEVEHWLSNGEFIKVDYKDETDKIIDIVLSHPSIKKVVQFKNTTIEKRKQPVSIFASIFSFLF